MQPCEYIKGTDKCVSPGICLMQVPGRYGIRVCQKHIRAHLLDTGTIKKGSQL